MSTAWLHFIRDSHLNMSGCKSTVTSMIPMAVTSTDSLGANTLSQVNFW